MLNVKTASWGGGSQQGVAKRAIGSDKASQHGNENHIKVLLSLGKIKSIFQGIGYFVPYSFSANQWVTLVPQFNQESNPPLRVYVNENCQSFYMLDLETGEMDFYALNGDKPDYSDDELFEKLRFGGVL